MAIPLFLRGRWHYTDQGILDRTHLRFFDEQGARALFDNTGLTVEAVSYNFTVDFLANCWLLRNSRMARWYTRKLLLSVMPRHLSAYQFLIRARHAG